LNRGWFLDPRCTAPCPRGTTMVGMLRSADNRRHPCKETRKQETGRAKNRAAAANLQAWALLFPVNTGEIQGIYRGVHPCGETPSFPTFHASAPTSQATPPMKNARAAFRRAQFRLWIFSYTIWPRSSKKSLSTHDFVGWAKARNAPCRRVMNRTRRCTISQRHARHWWARFALPTLRCFGLASSKPTGR
jgi:hypothetical protein